MMRVSTLVTMLQDCTYNVLVLYIYIEKDSSHLILYTDHIVLLKYYMHIFSDQCMKVVFNVWTGVLKLLCSPHVFVIM